jgi:hypothetical protein
MALSERYPQLGWPKTALNKGNVMADNKKQTGWQDDTEINVNESYELRDWSKKLGVTPADLKRAVKTVGASAKKVREFFEPATARLH